MTLIVSRHVLVWKVLRFQVYRWVESTLKIKYDEDDLDLLGFTGLLSSFLLPHGECLAEWRSFAHFSNGEVSKKY